ncbi:hypothetical protein F4604DRAFT_1688741 [Suillus subluteus]|nr:hypothetical protein F4604DRAFT_1688741 [Suillus subluteus]
MLPQQCRKERPADCSPKVFESNVRRNALQLNVGMCCQDAQQMKPLAWGAQERTTSQGRETPEGGAMTDVGKIIEITRPFEYDGLEGVEYSKLSGLRFWGWYTRTQRAYLSEDSHSPGCGMQTLNSVVLADSAKDLNKSPITAERRPPGSRGMNGENSQRFSVQQLRIVRRTVVTYLNDSVWTFKSEASVDLPYMIPRPDRSIESRDICERMDNASHSAGQEADGSMQTKTPSKLGSRDEMGCLEKVFGKMEETYDRTTESGDREVRRIYIDLPRFDFPVVFRESISAAFLNFFATDPHLWGILDPESAHENPVEDKHCQLVQSHPSSPKYSIMHLPASQLRGERLHLEVPLLPSTGQAWAYQVPQTGVDTDDTLELLGPGTVDSRVKAFVIRQFNHADVMKSNVILGPYLLGIGDWHLDNLLLASDDHFFPLSMPTVKLLPFC